MAVIQATAPGLAPGEGEARKRKCPHRYELSTGYSAQKIRNEKAGILIF
jgi:hypothetical protein